MRGWIFSNGFGGAPNSDGLDALETPQAQHNYIGHSYMLSVSIKRYFRRFGNPTGTALSRTLVCFGDGFAGTLTDSCLRLYTCLHTLSLRPSVMDYCVHISVYKVKTDIGYHTYGIVGMRKQHFCNVTMCNYAELL